jgi:hypothetical protein
MTSRASLAFYDVCIIGAGPAGLASALELANRGVSVALLESGADTSVRKLKGLSDAEVVSLGTHSVMGEAVQRGMGGTSSIWGGRCVPLDPIDFEHRPFVPDAAWPFDSKELAAYYTRACQLLGVGKSNFSSNQITDPYSANHSLSSNFSDNNQLLATGLERWCLEPNIWMLQRAQIQNHPLITLMKDYTCVGFSHAGLNQPVQTALALPTQGGESEVVELKARVFIIACGGVESTRLVLNSIANPAGLKLQSPHYVGRYYMGHPSGKIADIEFNGNPADTLYGFERDEDVYVRRRITFRPEVMRAHSLLNIAFWLDNPPIADWRHGSGVLSAAYLALTAPLLGKFLAPAAIRKRATGEVPSSRLRHIRNCLASPFKTIGFCFKFCYQRYFAKPRIPGFFTYSATNRYALHYHAEQAPNWDSCIALSDSVDALGMRRALINLQWSEQDVASIIKSHHILDEALRNNGIGKLRYRFCESELNAAVREQAVDGFHQIGTLRMANSPGSGVTDPFGRLFGTTNCYVASSATFPTSGQANPTLPLVAMAVRQAEHIAAKLLNAENTHA